jgi:hypothetical protein
MTLLYDRADARNNEVTPTFTVVSTATHDRAWWTAEVARTGTDWRSLTDAVLEVLVSDRDRLPHVPRADQGIAAADTHPSL